jgi:hypothetical protein
LQWGSDSTGGSRRLYATFTPKTAELPSLATVIAPLGPA